MSSGFSNASIEGVGLGLRRPHHEELLRGDGSVPWLEVLADNYAHAGGLSPAVLERLRSRYPMTLHGVGLSLGGADPLDRDYLGAIATLANTIEPAWISEHLAWTSVGGRHHHELLPLPFNEETVRTLAAHIREAQEILGRPILVENSVGYLSFECSDLSEAEFVGAVLEEADCLLLLDVNNVYVNACNHGFDADVYLAMIPPARVRQIHLAGHDERLGTLIDTHGSPVAQPVWRLYEQALRLFGDVPTCIEWDNDIPAFDVIFEQVEAARAIRASACLERQGAA
jgi:uncharacterized protein (UPF0276 family)